MTYPGTSGVAALSLVTMADAAVVVRRFQRRTAARRVTQLVQSGAVFADDFKALIGDETDVVIAAHLKLALRARGAPSRVMCPLKAAGSPTWTRP